MKDIENLENLKIYKDTDKKLTVKKNEKRLYKKKVIPENAKAKPENEIREN